MSQIKFEIVDSSVSGIFLLEGRCPLLPSVKRSDRFPQHDFRLEPMSVHGLWSTQVTMKPVKSGVGEARVESLRELQSATGEELDALLPSVLDRAFKGEL